MNSHIQNSAQIKYAFHYFVLITGIIFGSFFYSIAANAGSMTFPVVDTGQTTCYDDYASIPAPSPGNAFYGQDAQYKGNQPSYTISADGLTVHDNVTGLTWTRGADLNGDGRIDINDKLTYSEAQSYPDKLNAENYGGYSDWRVPTIKELYSLIDFRGTDPPPEGTYNSDLKPFIDTNYFAFAYGDMAAGERIIDSQWVTSTLYTGKVFGDMTAVFGVNFADGRIKGYPAEVDPRGNEKTFYVRLCRGNPAYGVNDFVDNHDGTITDKATGLMWSKNDSGSGMNWEDALAWVEQKNAENYLGHNDWRLPNAKELQSIVDYSRSPDATGSAAIDPVFNATQITNVAGQADYPYYWTGTTHVRFDGNASAAVYVAFGRGLGSMDGVNVIDVHGAGCQRSDPKDGDPNDYPSWGHGPQGDLQRVFNYVRIVRDATSSNVGSDLYVTIRPSRMRVGASRTVRVLTTDESGNQLENVFVTLFGCGVNESILAKTGVATFRNIVPTAPGEIMVTASKEGCPDFINSIKVTPRRR